MIGVGMIVALLPQRVHAMTGTLESVGLVASVFALAYLLAQLPVTFLSDRLGVKPFLVVGYLLCAASGLVFFAAASPAGIYLGRAVQGLGEAPIWALGPAALSLAYPASKGRVIGFYNAAIHAGLTAGPLLGLLVAWGGEAKLPFLVFAGLCLAAGCLVLLLLRAPRLEGSRRRVSPGQFLAVLVKRKPAVLLAGIFLYGGGYGLFVSILPVSLMESHGFAGTSVSWFFVLFYAGISVSQVVAGPVSDRIGRRGFLVWGMLLAAAGLGTFSFVPGFWTLLPLAVASIGLGTFCVAGTAELNECVPNALKGAISGSFYVFWGAGYILGPLVLGRTVAEAPLASYAAVALAFAVHALVASRMKD